MLRFEDFDTTKNGDGLLPAIIQDAAGRQVLMLGYMNAEAFARTLGTRRVTFYSRTRQCLWTKGETSGNYLAVKEMFADCDRDTLLVLAEPAGPVCHTGAANCFGTDPAAGFVGRLQQVVARRRAQMPGGSYTTRLFEKGTPKIAQKVGEEAVETVIEAVAGNKEAMIYEASDLVYHLLVLLAAQGLSWDDIEKELYSRHR